MLSQNSASSFSQIQHSTITPIQLSASTGRIVIGIKELSGLIHKSEKTIATWASQPKNAHKLPPRFRDGSNSVVWLLHVAWKWQDEVQERSASANNIIPVTPAKNEDKCRRGRPNTGEELAAKKAGMTVSLFRKTGGKV
jgi:hypothetical protein